MQSTPTEIQEHTCPECGKISPSKGGLGVHRRQIHGVVGDRGRKTLDDHGRGVVLYEALAEHADADNRVMIGLPELCKLDKQLRQISLGPRGIISATVLRKNLNYLIRIGSLRMNGNRVKILEQHPNKISPELIQTVNSHPVPVPKRRKAELDLMDTIETIPPEILADSIARKMWERYEWALSELGKMHAVVEQQEAEMRRLRLQIEGLEPVDAKGAARLILS